MNRRSPEELKAILQLAVPVIVRLGQRRMRLDEVLSMGPGAIIELPKPHDKPLELMVNNKVVGHGHAVKIGENFGLRVTDIGHPAERVHALGRKNGTEGEAADRAAENDASASPDASDADSPPDGSNEEAEEAAATAEAEAGEQR